MSNIQLTRSPIDNSVYVERKLASGPAIEQALALATKAQKTWCTSTIAMRAALCYKMVEAFVANQDEIAEQICAMMGRPIQYAKGEVMGVAERARTMITLAKDALANIELADKPGFIRYIKREPLGLVLVVAPWNYPYLTAINTIIPAIMAGNAVILKSSAQTPLCSEQLDSAFRQAGLPTGVFQYLHLSHDDTQALVGHAQINYVAFTGSVRGGQMMEKASSGRFIGLGLELGGKDPAYVRTDADLEHAVASCIDGAFFNSGQSCCAIERIYVDRAIFDDFVAQAVNLVKDYKLGRPDQPSTSLGPVVRASAADFVRRQVAEALAAGAKTHIDPAHFPLDQPGTAYLAPQILTQVDHSMSLMTEESFGPVVGIMPVDNEQQAITLMNDSPFGLTAAVYGADIPACIAIGEQLKTGTFFVNRCDYLDPELAWTGVKNSGRGCTLSSLAYTSLTRPKSFHIKINIR